MTNQFKVKSLILAMGVAFTSAPLYAEEAEGADDDDQVMVIVGSRAAPRSVGDSPVPVDVISGDEFVKSGAGDMVSMLASVVPSFNVNAQPISDAATLIRPANLRGLPPDNTLILVNGKRRHRASVIAFLGGGIADGSQGPDVSVIPSSALKQVEVLRDGAAAQYGSDAIAGVINFVLKDSASGGNFEVKYGEFFEGDGDTVQYSGNIGMPLTNDGFVNFSFEWKDQDPTSRSIQRDDAIDLIRAGNTNIRTPAAQVWGSPEVKDDFKFWLNTGIDLGDNKEAYMFANWAEREVTGGFFFRNPNTRGGVFSGDGGSTLLIGDLTPDDGLTCPVVPVVNNIPDATAFSQVASDPNCFSFQEMFPGGFTPFFGGTVVDVSLTAGTKGEFSNGISYDVSGYIGENSSNFRINNTVNASLGPNTPTSFKAGSYTQREKAFNADFVNVVGETMLAWGFEWRQDTFEIGAGDAASFEIGPLATQGFSSGSNGFNGFSTRSQGSFSRHNISAYIDAEQEFSDDLIATFALRYEDFSDFGSTTNFKVSGIYNVTDEFSLRGAVATGFRAPTIGQSNVTNVTTAFDSSLRLVDQATLPPTNPISVQLGGKQLQPEDSESYSVGFVYESESSLFVTADFFHIEVTDRIAQTTDLAVSAQDIADLLAQGVTDAANFTSIKFFTNDFDTTTQGLDLVVSYSAELAEGTDTKFSLAYNHTTTEVDSFNPAIISDTRVKQLEENLPEDKFTFTVSHQFGDIDSFFRVNYYGEFFEAHLDAGSLPIDVGSAVTVDAEIAMEVSESLRVAFGAQNMFDEYPDDNPYSGIVGAKYPVTSPFGFNGGFWYLKADYKFN
jgi:iron complex outermembrane receptor protein